MSARAAARAVARAAAAGLLAALLGCAGGPRTREVRTDFVPALLALPSVGAVPGGPDALRGRVLLVSFMATWCFPCLQAVPDLAQVQRRFQDQPFTVVLVGMDLEGAQVLEPFAQYYAPPYPVLVADEALRKGETAFGTVKELPTTVLLGKDGQPLTAYPGVASLSDLEAAVARALR